MHCSDAGVLWINIYRLKNVVVSTGKRCSIDWKVSCFPVENKTFPSGKPFASHFMTKLQLMSTARQPLKSRSELSRYRSLMQWASGECGIVFLSHVRLFLACDCDTSETSHRLRYGEKVQWYSHQMPNSAVSRGGCCVNPFLAVSHRRG